MSNEMNGDELKKDFLLLVNSFTQFPRNMTVEVGEMEASITLTVQAHADDTRKLIGGQGGHYRALKVIFSAIAMRIGKKFRFDIAEPQTGVQLPLTPFVQNPDWEKTETEKLLGHIVGRIFDKPFTIAHQAQSKKFSTFEVIITDMDYDDVLLRELGEAISKIFNAIGKSHGHLLYVDLVKKEKGKGKDSRESGTPLSNRVPV